MAPSKKRDRCTPASPSDMPSGEISARTTTNADSDGFATCNSQLVDLKDIFPKPTFAEGEADTYTGQGKTIPLHSRNTKDERLQYNTGNYAILPKPSGDTGNGPLTVENWRLLRKAYDEDMPSETGATDAVTANAGATRVIPESVRCELDLSINAIEAMVRYGGCFLFDDSYAVTRPGNTEETREVLSLLPGLLAMGKFVGRSMMRNIKTKADQERVQRKIRLLLQDRVLVACGGTVVPCDEMGEPIVAMGMALHRRYTTPALEGLFRYLSSDRDDRVQDTAAEHEQNPHVWTNNKVGPPVLTIKRRSEIDWDNELPGVGINVRYDKEYQDSKNIARDEEPECRRLILEIRAAAAAAAARKAHVTDQHKSGTERTKTPSAISTTMKGERRSRRTEAYQHNELPSMASQHDDRKQPIRAWLPPPGPRHALKVSLSVRNKSTTISELAVPATIAAVNPPGRSMLKLSNPSSRTATTSNLSKPQKSVIVTLRTTTLRAREVDETLYREPQPDLSVVPRPRIVPALLASPSHPRPTLERISNSVGNGDILPSRDIHTPGGPVFKAPELTMGSTADTAHIVIPMPVGKIRSSRAVCREWLQSGICPRADCPSAHKVPRGHREKAKLLVNLKEVRGLPWDEVKIEGNFEQAVSTLRGRYFVLNGGSKEPKEGAQGSARKRRAKPHPEEPSSKQ